MSTQADIVNALEFLLGLEDTGGREVFRRTQPVVIIGDTRDPFESNARIRRPASGGIRDSATVGELSSVSLLNPTSSGVDLLVESVDLNLENADFINVGLTSQANLAGSTNASSAGWRDSRLLPGLPAGQIHTLTQAAIAFAAAGGNFFAVDAVFHWPLNAVLSPGFAYLCRGQNTNAAVSATFVWTERAIQQL